MEDMGQEVCEGFHKDKLSRKDWEERNTEMMTDSNIWISFLK